MLLNDPNDDVRSSAGQLLVAMGPLSNSVVFWRVLTASYSYPESRYNRRVDAYLLFGDETNHALCISWLGDRSEDELLDLKTLKKDEAIRLNQNLPQPVIDLPIPASTLEEDPSPYRTGEFWDFQTIAAPPGSAALFTEQPVTRLKTKRRRK